MIVNGSSFLRRGVNMIVNEFIFSILELAKLELNYCSGGQLGLQLVGRVVSKHVYGRCLTGVKMTDNLRL